jgi:hypothetical protein
MIDVIDAVKQMKMEAEKKLRSLKGIFSGETVAVPCRAVVYRGPIA